MALGTRWYVKYEECNRSLHSRILWQLLVCSKKNGLCFLVTVWVRNLCILHRSQSFFCRWCSQRQSKHQKSLLNPRCCGAKAHIRPATLTAAAAVGTTVPAKACHHSHCSLSSNSFHGQITQKAVHQLSDQENKKISLRKFLEQTTLKLCDLLFSWIYSPGNKVLVRQVCQVTPPGNYFLQKF